MIWVIVSKFTGKMLEETSSAELAAALDPERAYAVPIAEYLAALDQTGRENQFLASRLTRAARQAGAAKHKAEQTKGESA